MSKISRLIPELEHWNDGKGIDPENWIYIEGRADHALGYCSLMWPDVIQFEGYVLRGPLDVDRLKGWERAGHSFREIETAMNAFFLADVFPEDPTESILKGNQIQHFALVMADMLSAKLHRDFPDRRFSAFVLEGDDFGVSFHQI